MGMRQKPKKPVIQIFGPLVATLVLSGCGGSGGGEPQVTALDDMNVAIGELQADHPAGTYTPLNDPAIASGTVKYNGFLRANLANETDDVTDILAGQMELEVAFDATDMVTGTARGFVDEDGQTVTGELTLSGGTLDRDGDPALDFTFQFDGDGVLRSPSGQLIGLEVSFDGDFLGDSGEAVGGDVAGTATVDGNAQNLQGPFIAAVPTP